MKIQVEIRLDERAIEAMKAAVATEKLRNLERRMKAQEEAHYWLDRIVNEVALAPDERARAINAGYGW